MSGHVGQGGTVVLRTYLLRSGSLHGGAGGHTGRVLPLHPEQGHEPPHSSQRGSDPPSSENPSFDTLRDVEPSR